MNEYKKIFSKIGFNYLLLALIPIFLQIIIVNVIALWDIHILGDFNTRIVISSMCNYILVLPVFIYLMKRIESTEITREKPNFKTIIVYLSISLTLMWIGNLIGIGITTLLGNILVNDIENPIETLIKNSSIYICFIVICILAPIFEEIFFRKLLIDRTIKYGAKLSIILSALLFALFHGNLSQFFYAFLLGAFFAYVYIKTGNIIYSIIMHAFVNFYGSVASTFFTFSMQNVVNGITMANAGDIAIIAAYLIILLIAWCIGLYKIFTNYNKIELKDSAREIFLDKPVQTVLLNIGMICFIAYHIFKIMKSLNLI